MLPPAEERGHLAMAFTTEDDEIAVLLRSEVFVASVMRFQGRLG
jgi:hypothetical protein